MLFPVRERHSYRIAEFKKDHLTIALRPSRYRLSAQERVRSFSTAIREPLILSSVCSASISKVMREVF